MGVRKNSKDLTGLKFNRLTCIKFVGRNKQYDSLWLCKCECGNEKVIRGGVILNSHTQSCGCLQKQRTAESHTTHSLYYDSTGKRSKLYHVWGGMKERCFSPNHKFYKYYGGRGITICEEWMDYKTFYNWAMANGYEEGLSIERIRVNENYGPSNCKWISNLDQAKNKTSSVVVEYNGETKNLSEWAEILGKKGHLLALRLRRGWSITRAFTT